MSSLHPEHTQLAAVLTLCVAVVAATLAAVSFLGDPSRDASVGSEWGKTIPHAFPAAR